MANTQSDEVSILGCGWIGFSLAKSLVSQGITVLGTSTSESKKQVFEDAGILHFTFQAGKDAVPEAMLNTKTLVIAFPPKSKSTDGEWYRQAIEKICFEIINNNIKKVILLSSTSVYPETAVLYKEDTIINDEDTGNRTLFLAEKLILELPLQVYALRLGGLAGADRFLARHFAGKSNLKNGNNPVNLLHQDDATNIIQNFILKDYEPGIYNVCAPEHPTRKELYIHDCKKAGLPIPEFDDTGSAGKIISNQKLLLKTSYQFKYPDPKEFSYNLLF